MGFPFKLYTANVLILFLMFCGKRLSSTTSTKHKKCVLEASEIDLRLSARIYWIIYEEHRVSEKQCIWFFSNCFFFFLISKALVWSSFDPILNHRFFSGVSFSNAFQCFFFVSLLVFSILAKFFYFASAKNGIFFIFPTYLVPFNWLYVYTWRSQRTNAPRCYRSSPMDF